MPELPEVETVKRILEPQLAGRRITKLTANRPEVIKHPSAEEFERLVTGARIERMGRRGKFLFIFLENGDRILLHLRMTGQLLVTPKELPLEKHTHLIFHLDDGNELRFIDLRRFGRFWLIRAGEKDDYSGVAKLGPEPFDGEFTGSYLSAALGGRRKALKQCLMDQNIVAGIGNIYGDEILFAAKLAPTRPASSLTQAEWDALAAVIPAVLAKGIEDDRMTAEEYLETRGLEYRKTPHWQVYGRDGEPCPRCGATLKKVAIGGRNSVFCPDCQPELTK